MFSKTPLAIENLLASPEGITESMYQSNSVVLTAAFALPFLPVSVIIFEFTGAVGVDGNDGIGSWSYIC